MNLIFWINGLYSNCSYYVHGIFDTGEVINTNSNISYESRLRLSFLQREGEPLTNIIEPIVCRVMIIFKRASHPWFAVESHDAGIDSRPTRILRYTLSVTQYSISPSKVCFPWRPTPGLSQGGDILTYPLEHVDCSVVWLSILIRRA